MTLAIERTTPAPPAAAAAELAELAPAAVVLAERPRELSPRPHYIVAGLSAGVEASLALIWLVVRPASETAEYLLIVLATIAGSALVGAAGFISSGKPMPERKA